MKPGQCALALIASTVFICAPAHSVELEECSEKQSLKAGDNCYVGVAPFCNMSADNCTKTVRGKELTWSGNSCWGTAAICGVSCTTGNKAICVVDGPASKIDHAAILPMLREIQVNLGFDPLGIVEDSNNSALGDQWYHDTFWWQVLRQPSPGKFGCNACLDALNTMADIVGSLGWATVELGPFISAGMAPFRFIGQQVFGERYQRDAVQVFDTSQMQLISALNEDRLRTTIADQVGIASAANSHLKGFFSVDYNAPYEGTTLTALKSLTNPGSPVGIASIFAAQHKLISLDRDGHIAPAGLALPPPARVYAAGAWLFTVNTYLQALKAAAVLQVFPRECSGAVAAQACRTKYSDKTLAGLFQESWQSDAYYLNRILTDISNSDDGFIKEARDLRAAILNGVKDRLDMIKTGSGVYSTCDGSWPVGTMPIPDGQSYSGGYVTDTGLEADFGLGSVVDPARMRRTYSSFICVTRQIHVDYLVAIDPLDDLNGADPQNRRSALSDGRHWAFFVAQRYRDIYGYDIVATIDAHIEAWKRLVADVCAIVPTRDGVSDSIYCPAKGRS